MDRMINLTVMVGELDDQALKEAYSEMARVVLVLLESEADVGSISLSVTSVEDDPEVERVVAAETNAQVSVALREIGIDDESINTIIEALQHRRLLPKEWK